MSVEYSLTLDYQLQAGWLEPYVQGLLQGVAKGRCCTACKRTSFPPIRVCECQHIEGEWVTLSGVARIVYRCDGSEGSFAFVHFDGADTHTVVRLDGVLETDLHGILKSPQSSNSNDTPALVLTAHQPETDRGRVNE